MDLSQPIRRRRQHAPEFKRRLVTLHFNFRGSLAHRVNANLLRRWIKQFAGGLPSQAITAPVKLMPVQVDLTSDSPVSDAIQISIQKGHARISIRWPGQQ